MAWLKVDQALTNHKKTFKLSCDLNIPMPHAVGLMVTLWLWALDNTPDGSLEDIPAPLLARVLDWSGDPEELLQAMQSAGFIDDNHIHDWDEYAGKLIDQRIAERERSKKRRSSLSVDKYLGDQQTTTGRSASDRQTTIGRLDQSRVEKTKEDINPLPPKGERQQAIPFEKIMSLYNETCVSFPKILRIDGQRQRAVAARWKAHGNIEAFQTLFKKTEASSFLKGQNDRNWRADFDWIMKATNMAKVLEGKYDGKSLSMPQGKNNQPEYNFEGWHFAGDEGSN